MQDTSQLVECRINISKKGFVMIEFHESLITVGIFVDICATICKVKDNKNIRGSYKRIWVKSFKKTRDIFLATA